MDNRASLVVFLARSKMRLNAPLVRIFARLHASSAKKQIMPTECRSSDSDSGLSRHRAVIRRQAVVTASVSLVQNKCFPFDLDKLDRIFNDCARNGLASFAKQIMLVMLLLF